jgi:hypothetical protein
VTIETTWVRLLFGSPGRILATAVILFVLIVAAPIVLAIVGLWVVSVLICLVGLACVAAIAFAMLPGRHHRR